MTYDTQTIENIGQMTLFTSSLMNCNIIILEKNVSLSKQMKLDITCESRSQTLWGYSLIEIKCVSMVIPIQLIGMHLHVISLATLLLCSFHFVYTKT